MAGYSDNREQNLEIKYLGKVLRAVDSHLQVPDSLRGSALLHKLDGVTQDPLPEEKVRMILPKGWFTLRSGLTYAAAFLLIVGLFYGMGFHNQNDMVTGEISIAPSVSDNLLDEPLLDGGGRADAFRIAPEEENDAPDPQTGGQEAPKEAAIPFGFSVEAPEENPVTGGGLGGNGPSATLGEYREYLLVCRPNDNTDPARLEEAPLTLELLREDALVSKIEIPHLAAIEGFYGEGNIITLVGFSPDGVGSVILDLTDPEAPVAMGYLPQAGTLREARVAGDILHVLTYSPNPEEAEGTATALPDSIEEGACIITAIDLQTGLTGQAAFLGAGEEMKLFNISAYLYYNTLTPEGETERNIAQINLQGTAIELAGIS